MTTFAFTQIIPKSTAGKVAACAGLCFLGYCIYFDRKRRSHPDFKKNLRERRRRVKQQKQSSGVSQIPTSTDPDVLQKFFLDSIQNGEKCIATGDIEEGVEHLANAVVVCGQHDQLLQVFQQTLPPGVFQLLIQKPQVLQRLQQSMAAQAAMPTPKVMTMGLAEDDVE